MDTVAAIGILVIVAIVLIVYITLFENRGRKVIIVKEAPHNPWALSWQPWYRVGPYGGPHGYHG
jgi:hypothetical protein